MPYYHVLLELDTNNLLADTEDFFETDLSQDDVEHIGRQYQEGSKVFFKGKWIEFIRIKRIEIRKTNQRAEEYSGWNPATYNIFYNEHGENVTRAFIISNSSRKKRNKSHTVFIVHGRDRTPALELEKLLEKEFQLEPVLLLDKPHRGRTIPEKFEHYSDVGYAFIIITPDDIGALKGEFLRDRARQNVIFEWGHFIAKLGREKTCILLKGSIELPSDMHGMGYHRFYENVKEVFLDIKEELKDAGLVN